MTVLRWALVLACSFTAGCTFKLAAMSRDHGRASMKCEEAQWKMRFKSAEGRSYIVYGCGQWELYEGSCNGEQNGCDRAALNADCDGGCRTRLVERGELEPDGSIPERILKPRQQASG